MKTHSLFILLFFSLFFTACEENNEIYYPPSGTHGSNLLLSSGELGVEEDETYSMRADLSKNSKLKLRITNTSNYTGPVANAPKWILSGENNWSVSTYQSYYQEFNAMKGSEKADIAIQFNNSPGSARIDFYENSTNITRTMTIIW